jgi:hypothetical protein
MSDRYEPWKATKREKKGLLSLPRIRRRGKHKLINYRINDGFMKG